jgi:hypothetical protein
MLNVNRCRAQLHMPVSALFAVMEKVVNGDLYNTRGDKIGHVDFSGGRVTDSYGRYVGKVMTYGSGSIEDTEGWGRQADAKSR